MKGQSCVEQLCTTSQQSAIRQPAINRQQPVDIQEQTSAARCTGSLFRTAVQTPHGTPHGPQVTGHATALGAVCYH